MRNKIHFILFLAGIVILGLLIWDFGVRNIITDLKKIGLWFIPVFLIWGIVYFLNAWAWFIVLGKNRESLSFLKIFGINLSGFSINYITPFINLGGEPYKISALKKYIGMEKSVSTVTLYRMIHILAHLIFWLFIIPITFYILPDKGGSVFLLIALFILFGLLVLFFFSRHKKGIYEELLNLISKVFFLKYFSRKLEKYRDNIQQIDLQIRDLFLTRKRAFFAALLLEFVSRFVASFEFFFILSALKIDITVLESFYIYAASSLFLNIVFFMPLEMGTREGSLYLVFHAFNFNPELAVFVGLINRIREIFWIMIGILLIQINNRSNKRKTFINLPNMGESYESNNI